jgi:hypothetical protein
MDWLRLLSRWVGDAGHVTGTDVDERMLAASGALRDEERLANLTLTHDDVFASALPRPSTGYASSSRRPSRAARDSRSRCGAAASTLPGSPSAMTA